MLHIAAVKLDYLIAGFALMLRAHSADDAALYNPGISLFRSSSLSHASSVILTSRDEVVGDEA